MPETRKTAVEYVTRRLPILQATATLGIRDAEVARLLDVTPITVSEWAVGKRPIPRARHALLRQLVHMLAERLNWAAKRLSAKEARRLEVAAEVASKWYALSSDEIRKPSEDEAAEGLEGGEIASAAFAALTDRIDAEFEYAADLKKLEKER
jgi:predicted transcriptional regulator